MILKKRKRDDGDHEETDAPSPCMSSDLYIHDASHDEFYYSEGDAMDSDEGSCPSLDCDSDSDDGFDDESDHETTSCRGQDYTILSEDDIWQRQDERIAEISTVLFVSEISAKILIHHYNWSVTDVHEAWFADEEKVCATAGLLEKEEPTLHYSNTKELFSCLISFESYPPSSMYGVACGHLFCGSCWNGYISTSINDGPGCLMLRCPDPSCPTIVGQDMVNKLVSKLDRDKYSRYLLRFYIEASRNIKWCPAPGCVYVVHFVLGSGSYDVSCNCKYGFCWNCTEDDHRPVDCNTVRWLSTPFKNILIILKDGQPTSRRGKRPSQIYKR